MFALVTVVFNQNVLLDFNVLAVLKESYVAECFTFAHIYALAISKIINKVVGATN